MAKIDDYQPSQVEVDKVLYCKKIVNFSGVKWKQKPSRSDMWLQAHIIPLDEDCIPIQGLKFELKWKPDQDSEPDDPISYPKINIIAFYHNKRVFAVDTYHFDKHTNSYKVDHPKYQDIIYGAHYHVYYEEAGYYSDRIAFPIEDDINPDNLVGYWNYFCKHLNITYSGRIPLPLEDESGQMGFGI